MSDASGSPARVLGVSRKLHRDRRFSIAVWAGFIAGMGLMYDALFTRLIPSSGTVGWLMAAGAAVIYVQVEFQSAVGTLRSHPKYRTIPLSRKLALWFYLLWYEHWLLGFVAFGLIWIGLAGFVFVHPFLFVPVVAYAGAMVVLGSVKFRPSMTREAFDSEMGVSDGNGAGDG